MEYGLIGEKLGHSYSKLIQEKLLDHYLYEIHPIPKDKIDSFMKEKSFKGINVTIPYKETVIPYLDEIDEHANYIGAVNTIINKNGILKGYNTDYCGFAYTLEHHHITIENKKVLVLGNGGGSKAVKAVLKDKKAKQIITTSRTIKDDVVGVEEVYLKHNDIQIIVNTTPLGMYPNVNNTMLELSFFPHLEACVDIVYNPHNTQFILDAKALNIKTAGGLEMLVGQAKKALELFKDIHIDDSKIDEIYYMILKQTLNIAVTKISDEELYKLSKLSNKEIIICRNKKELQDAAILNSQIIHITFAMDDKSYHELKRNSYLCRKQKAKEILQEYHSYIINHN